MLRALLAAFGLVELLFPDKLVAAMTRLAYEDGGEMTAKPWVTTAARVEGATLLLVALVGLRGRCGGDGEGEDEDE
ncbi:MULTISPECIES: hypothetical protein [Haloferax]|uniref:Uncharacterized protein n=1 Tax=Haloferax massiliensis TaxID=1476858 RepID=A0A0D6JXU9_9EURY|nr:MULTISPECIES: hypothetical protein [Haloferax]MDS0242876.1 hypothetical protein [Haloferax sp. S2CR25]MDS0445997.1 hypothetical protein [Haloferax sp. S2CR25-2]CQR54126.1 hypothetical protein BN996_03952 [Haloferax massiliensis]